MASNRQIRHHRWSEPYSLEESAIWRRDSMADSTPSGASSVTLLPLSNKYEVFSSFGEQDCGEPSKPQHLVFDFTPDPEIDNEEAQEKCVAFWDFIQSQPVMRELCVKPGPSPDTVAAASPALTGIAPVGNTPAVDVLNRNSHDFIRFGFGDKMVQSKCTLGADSYSEADPTLGAKTAAPVKSKPISMCVCSGICSKCRKAKAKPCTDTSKEPLQKLNRILDDWDTQHPKSMDPPGALMQHKPILQRRLPDQDPKTCFD